MNPAIIISLFSGIFTISIGLYVLKVEPKKYINRIFFLWALSIATFSISEFFVRIAPTPEIALLFGISAYSILWHTPSLGLHWAWVFPRKVISNRYDKIIKYTVASTYVVGFILFIIFINLVTLQDVIETEWGFRLIPSPSTFFFVVWWLFVCILITIVFAYKYFKENLYPTEKNQLKMIWYGAIFLIISALSTNLIPPLFNVQIFPMTSLFSVFFVLFIAYAIVKYRFLLPSPEIVAEKILDTMNDIVIVLDINFNIIRVNKATTELLGYDLKELINSSFYRLIDVSENNKTNNKKTLITSFFNDKLNKGRFEDVELDFINKTGKKIPMSTSASIITSNNKIMEGFVLVARDLSETKKSLKEKEILIKEIHHRVKNNLQLISSLLGLQSDQIGEKILRDKFLEAQNRVKMMASFYEQLYQSGDVSEIKFEEYIKNIVVTLFNFHRYNTDNVSLKLNIDNVPMDLNTSLVCGFIISELVSNSLKHAFPDKKKGDIIIDFHKDNKFFELIVQDTGVGMSKDVDFRNTKTLGLRLVNMFIKQLDGNIDFDSTKGTKFTITFTSLKKDRMRGVT